MPSKRVASGANKSSAPATPSKPTASSPSSSSAAPTPNSPKPTSTTTPITSNAKSPSLNRKSGKGTTAGASLVDSVQDLWRSYNETTPSRLKLLDGFQFFLMLTGITQFLYCILITNFPFNAFISGFAATVGQFVLTAAMRAQINPKNKGVFPTISPERAFADFAFGSLLLHFFVYNYLG